eukprot:SAG25_NODE_317_length_9961_cov_5.088724_10_plen_195_part_00
MMAKQALRVNLRHRLGGRTSLASRDAVHCHYTRCYLLHGTGTMRFAASAASATAAPHAPAGEVSMVDCSKVCVKADAWGGAGAFAAVDIAEGEVVEKGIARVLTNCDGNHNPYVFTWSDEVPNETWALGSGCSTFYNTCEASNSNTHMERDFLSKSFVITATKDINAGDELLHVYKSKQWRACFRDALNPTPAD